MLVDLCVAVEEDLCRVVLVEEVVSATREVSTTAEVAEMADSVAPLLEGTGEGNDDTADVVESAAVEGPRRLTSRSAVRQIRKGLSMADPRRLGSGRLDSTPEVLDP